MLTINLSQGEVRVVMKVLIVMEVMIMMMMVVVVVTQVCVKTRKTHPAESLPHETKLLQNSCSMKYGDMLT